MSEKRRGLGRGLGALIPSGPVTSPESTPDTPVASSMRQESKTVLAKPPHRKQAQNEGGVESLSSKGSDSSPRRKEAAAAGRVGSDAKMTGDNASAQKKNADAPASGKKTTVSRETLSESRDQGKGGKPATRSRRDMGQALRNTTSVRRPVDMFFLPSDDADEDAEVDAPSAAVTAPVSQNSTGLPEVEIAQDVSRATPNRAGKNVQSTGGVLAVDEPSVKDAQSTAIVSPTPTPSSPGATVGSRTLAHEETLQSGSSSPNTADTDPDVSRETSDDPSARTDMGQLEVVPGAEFAEIPVADIHPNRKQPRQIFDEDELAELAFSVKELGILQPVVVRPSREGEGAKYELVMGERRWRAVQKAGLNSVPAIIRETADDDLLRDALLENLHRSQLNPLEEAAAYQQLLEEFGATQDELSRRIGRSRPQISNTLRLLRLPALVQRRVAAGVLSSGHARALLGLTDPAEMERLAQRVVAEGMSVRATEETVALSGGLKRHATKRKSSTHRHDDRLNYIADAFSNRLDTSVKIQLGARKGKMTIEFASVEDLNRIIDVLDPKEAGGQ